MAWLRPENAVREYGLTALLYAGIAVHLLIALGDPTLGAFPERIVSEATLEDRSVGFRSSAFFRAAALAPAVFLLVLVSLRALERIAERGWLRLLAPTSLAGILALVLALEMNDGRLAVGGAVGLLLALQALLVTIAMGARSWGDPIEPGARAVHLAALFAYGLAIPFPVLGLIGSTAPRSTWWLAPAAALLGFSLHVLFRCTCLADPEGKSTRGDRLIHAALPLAALPLVSVLRDEVYLFLNARGVHDVAPTAVHLALLAALSAWGALRWWRGRRRAGGPDLRRTVECGVIPWMLVGAVAYWRYLPVLEPTLDYFEPANSGLMIQQWFDFGRLPFFETFNAHNLSDGFFGLIYALLYGVDGDSWGFYDFGHEVLRVLVVYLFLRRFTGSAWLALFAVALLPDWTEVFPPYCALALTTVFVLRWALDRRSTTAYFALFLYLAALIQWRIDLAFANGAAAIAALAAARALAPEHRPDVRRAAGGAAAAAAVCALASLAVFAWRGIEPLVFLDDLRHILLSNQSFGFPRLAERIDVTVVWHVACVPALVVALLVVFLRRSRGSALRNGQERVVFLGTVFLGVYFLANFPRGLVRHTFMEPGNVYLVSTSAAFLLLSAYWLWRDAGPMARFAAFAVGAVILPRAFPVWDTEVRREYPPRSTADGFVRTVRTHDHVEPTDERVDRCPPNLELAESVVGVMETFIEENLGPDQTFLDLSNSPMLFYFTRRRSPHYANHLLVASDDHLMRRVLDGLEDVDAPIAILDEGLEMDGVPMALRQYLLFEHVYQHYDPLFEVAERWQIWGRRGWAPSTPPQASTRESLFTWRSADEPEPEGALRFGFGAGGPERPGTLHPLRFETGALPCLVLEGLPVAGGDLSLRWTARRGVALTDVERFARFRLEGTSGTRVVPLGGGHEPTEITGVEIAGTGTAWQPAVVELVDLRGPFIAPLLDRLDNERPTLQLRHLGRLWGEHDPGPEGETVRVLHEGGPITVPVDAPVELRFEPMGDPLGEATLLLRLVNTVERVQRVVVEHGEGEASTGRFSFLVPGDGREHVYAVRLGVHRAWHRRRLDRVALWPSHADVVLERASITVGP